MASIQQNPNYTRLFPIQPVTAQPILQYAQKFDLLILLWCFLYLDVTQNPPCHIAETSFDPIPILDCVCVFLQEVLFSKAFELHTVGGGEENNEKGKSTINHPTPAQLDKSRCAYIAKQVACSRTVR